MIYFVREKGTRSPVKIGYSATPWMRLSELQAGNPRPLELVGVLPGTTIHDEGQLHRELDAARLGREWFKVTKAVREVMRRASKPPPRPPTRDARFGCCVRGHRYTAGNTFYVEVNGQPRRRCRRCAVLPNPAADDVADLVIEAIEAS